MGTLKCPNGVHSREVPLYIVITEYMLCFLQGIMQLMKVNFNSRLLKFVNNHNFARTEIAKKNKTEILAVFGNNEYCNGY